MTTPVKFIFGILIAAVTAAVAFSGVKQTGDAQKTLINKSEEKASSMLD